MAQDQQASVPRASTTPTTIVGVFARPDHPVGWGYPIHCSECGNPTHGGRAHGYVVLFVRCADSLELERVTNRLLDKPFHGIGGDGQYASGNLHEWFGGRFDLIATVPDVDFPGAPFSCKGDNRMIARYDAAEVLA